MSFIILIFLDLLPDWHKMHCTPSWILNQTHQYWACTPAYSIMIQKLKIRKIKKRAHSSTRCLLARVIIIREPSRQSIFISLGQYGQVIFLKNAALAMSIYYSFSLGVSSLQGNLKRRPWCTDRGIARRRFEISLQRLNWWWTR